MTLREKIDAAAAKALPLAREHVPDGRVFAVSIPGEGMAWLRLRGDAGLELEAFWEDRAIARAEIFV